MSEAHDQTTYEAEIISLRPWGLQRREQPGISDEDMHREWVLQQKWRNWIEMGLALMAEMNDISVMSVAEQTYLDWVHDEAPVKLDDKARCDFTNWDNQLEEKRHG